MGKNGFIGITWQPLLKFSQTFLLYYDKNPLFYSKFYKKKDFSENLVSHVGDDHRYAKVKSCLT